MLGVRGKGIMWDCCVSAYFLWGARLPVAPYIASSHCGKAQGCMRACVVQRKGGYMAGDVRVCQEGCVRECVRAIAGLVGIVIRDEQVVGVAP